MKPLIEINLASGVACPDASKGPDEQERQPSLSFDAMVEAIDLRAHYVGPVLEGILHIDLGPGFSANKMD